MTQAVAGEALDDAGVVPGELDGGRDHQPARDRLRVGPAHGRAAAPRDRVAGPPDGARAATSCARRARAARPRADRAGPRPVLLGDEDRVAAARTSTGCASARASGRAVFGTIDAWLIYKLTRRARDRPLERVADDAVRHPPWGAGTTSCSSCSGSPERALPEVVTELRRDRARRGRTRSTGTRCRRGRRRRPAGGAVRAGCVDPGSGKNTYGTGSFVLQNAGYTRPSLPRACSATVAWGIGGRLDVRARGGDLRHRRGRPVAARRPRDDRRGRRDRAARRPVAGANDGVYFVPGADRLGSPHWDPYARGHDRRADARDRRGPTWRAHARGDRLPDRRRRARDGSGQRRRR